MENINKHSYFALRLQEGEYAYTKPVDGYSLCGGAPFSVSFSFYLLKKDIIFSFLKQEGAFDIGYDMEKIYYRAQGLGNIETSQGELVLAENTWNVLDITYDGKKIIFYLNGISGFQKSVTAIAFTNKQDYRIGEGLQGYLRFAKGYNYCLLQNEIVNNQIISTINQDKMEFFLDFSGAEPMDKGKHALGILFSGLSSIKNLVKTLSLENYSFCVPLNSEKVNPGSFSTNEFTILSKIFMKPGKNKDMVILTNGGLESDTGLTLGMRYNKQTDGYYLFLKWGEEEVVSTTKILDFHWVDVAAVFSKSAMKLFIDGKKDGEKTLTAVPSPQEQGDIVIGNTLYNGRPGEESEFGGYIDYIGVFDRELGGDQLSVFLQNPPFIYEDHLVALYGFWEEEACDYLRGSLILFSNNAKVSFQENTVFSTEIGEITYHFGETTKAYTEFQKWQINTIAGAVTSFITAQTGVSPTAGMTQNGQVVGKIADLIAKEVLREGKVQELLASYNKLSSSQVNSMMKGLFNKGSLDKLILSFFSKSSGFSLLTLPAINSVFLGEEAAFYVAAAALIATATAVAVKSKTKEPPEPVPPIPDPEVKYRFVSVKSITFRHDPSNVKVSAINIRKNKEEMLPVPEWVKTINSSSTNPSIASYIKGKIENGFLKVIFYYETNYTDSITGSITANCTENSILGDIDGVNVTFSNTGEYAVDIPLSHHSINSKQLGRFEEQLNWKCSFIGFIGASHHRIYTIGGIPIAPFSIDSQKPNQFPMIGDLEILADVMKYTEKSEVSNVLGETLENVAGSTIRMLMTSGRFAYPEDAEPIYSSIPEDTNIPVFDRVRFDGDFNRGGRMNVNCLDCSLFIAYMCHLNGHQIQIMSIHSDEEYIKVDGEEFPPPMFFREVKVIGKDRFEVLAGIDTHYLAVTGEGSLTGTYVFDGSIMSRTLENQDLMAIHLPFTNSESNSTGPRDVHYYREAFFEEGSSCTKDIFFQQWTQGEVREVIKPAKIPRLGEGFYVHGNILGIASGGREGFDPLIIRDMVCGPDQARCHSVSYGSLCVGICTPINEFLLGNYNDIARLEGYLRGIKTSAFIDGDPGGGFSRFFNGADNDIAAIIAEIRWGTKDIKKICGRANELIKNLNNARGNLRLGNTNWNSSIQTAFDPVSWLYVDNGNRVLSSDTSISHNPPGVFPPVLPPPVGEGFYLTNERDGRRLNVIMGNTMGDGSFSILKGTESGTIHKLLFSSSNGFPLPNTSPTAGDVYYLVANAWVKY